MRFFLTKSVPKLYCFDFMSFTKLVFSIPENRYPIAFGPPGKKKGAVKSAPFFSFKSDLYPPDFLFVLNQLLS